LLPREDHGNSHHATNELFLLSHSIPFKYRTLYLQSHAVRDLVQKRVRQIGKCRDVAQEFLSCYFGVVCQTLCGSGTAYVDAMVGNATLGVTQHKYSGQVGSQINWAHAMLQIQMLATTPSGCLDGLSRCKCDSETHHPYGEPPFFVLCRQYSAFQHDKQFSCGASSTDGTSA
jgi:hypothetical protein